MEKEIVEIEMVSLATETENRIRYRRVVAYVYDRRHLHNHVVLNDVAIVYLRHLCVDVDGDDVCVPSPQTHSLCQQPALIVSFAQDRSSLPHMQPVPVS
jgi:CO dehydrogenase/acetyl-CoA synthase beta subunit